MANALVPAIPQDIIDCIIEVVDDDGLLRTCALVSSSFLLPSRKRLFSHIFLRDDQACRRLYQFLVDNPVVQSFIRSIAIDVDNWLRDYRSKKNSRSELNQSTSLITVLRLQFRHLESLSIHSLEYRSGWDDFSSELKDTLSTVIHSTTVKTLKLYELADIPMVLFQGIHLSKLELYAIWPNNFDSLENASLLTPAPGSKGGSITTLPVIDHCVWNHYLDGVLDHTEPIFLPFMCRLRVLEICVQPYYSAFTADFKIMSFIIRSLRISLTSPPTLEHVKFRIVFENPDNSLSHHVLFNDLRDDDVWTHLDSIVTHPTGSRLQRVDINIDYMIRCNAEVAEPDETEVEEPVLNALPLLSKKGILFVKGKVGRQSQIEGTAIEEGEGDV